MKLSPSSVLVNLSPPKLSPSLVLVNLSRLNFTGRGGGNFSKKIFVTEILLKG